MLGMAWPRRYPLKLIPIRHGASTLLGTVPKRPDSIEQPCARITLFGARPEEALARVGMGPCAVTLKDSWVMEQRVKHDRSYMNTSQFAR